MTYIATFVISLCYFFLLSYFQVANLWTVLIGAFFILTILMYPLLRSALWETDMQKIEAFLLKNKRNPSFYIIYALANQLDDEVRKTTKLLIDKTNSVERKALYKLTEALHFKDITSAKNEIEKVKPGDYRYYYEASILFAEGKFAKGNELMSNITKEWMKNALLADREKMLDNLEQAKSYAAKAINQTRGFQRYSLEKTFQRELAVEKLR